MTPDNTPDPRDVALRECITVLRIAQTCMALPSERKLLEDTARRAERVLLAEEGET